MKTSLAILSREMLFLQQFIRQIVLLRERNMRCIKSASVLPKKEKSAAVQNVSCCINNTSYLFLAVVF